MRYLFFLTVLASAGHLKSEETATTTQIITECTGSSSYSHETSSSNLSSSLSCSTHNVLPTSTTEIRSSNISAILSDSTFYTPTSSTIGTITRSFSGTSSSSTFNTSSIGSTNRSFVCTAGVTCNCTSNTLSNCTSHDISSSSRTISSIGVIENLSSSTSDLTTYIPAITSTTTASTSTMASSSQQKSKHSPLPEYTTTTTRTRIETYYTWYPDSESQFSKQTASSVSTVHSWYDVILTMTVTDTITATTTETMTATATTTACADSGASRNIHLPYKVSHHSCHNMSSPRWKQTVIVTPECSSLSLVSAMSEVMSPATVTAECPLPLPSLSSGSLCHQSIAVTQLSDTQLQSATMSRIRQPYSREHSAGGQITVSSSMPLLPDQPTTVRPSTTQMPIPKGLCLLDQDACHHSDESVARSEPHKIKESARGSEIPPKASKSTTGIPAEVAPRCSSGIDLEINNLVVREPSPGQIRQNCFVEHSLPVTNQTNKIESTSASVQTNSAQARSSNQQSLPITNPTHGVVSGPIRKPLIPIQQEILPSSTPPGLSPVSNHTSLTMATMTTSTVNAPTRIMTGSASGTGHSYIALIIAVTMLVL